MELQKWKTLPRWSDANMSYAATGFIEAVKEAGGIPLICQLGGCGHGQTLYVDRLISSSLLVVKMSCPSFMEKKSPLIAMTTSMIFLSWPWLRKRVRLKKSDLYRLPWDPALQCRTGGTLYQDIEHHWQDNPGQYTSQELVPRIRRSCKKNLWQDHQFLSPSKYQRLGWWLRSNRLGSQRRRHRGGSIHRWESFSRRSMASELRFWQESSRP